MISYVQVPFPVLSGGIARPKSQSLRFIRSRTFCGVQPISLAASSALRIVLTLSPPFLQQLLDGNLYFILSFPFFRFILYLQDCHLEYFKERNSPHMEYKDVELTAQQIKLLKQLKRTDIAETLQNKADLTVLKKLKLDKCINTNEAFYRSISKVYSITSVGRMWLQFNKKDILRTWYPHIIATLALIVSIIAIAISIYSCNAAQPMTAQAQPPISTASSVQYDIDF